MSSTSERDYGTLRQAFAPVVAFIAITLVGLSVARLGLVAWQMERVTATNGAATILLEGPRFDIVTISTLVFIPLVLALILFMGRRTYRTGELMLRGAFALLLVAFALTEIATPGFIEEFDTRPNYLFFEYLEYPREVLATLWGAYPWRLMLMVVAAPAVFFAGLALFRRTGKPLAGPLRPSVALVAVVVVTALCVLGARGTLDHRPINPSTACFSTDALVNTLPLNSLYSAGYAIYESKKNEGPDASAYGELPYDEVIATVRADAGFADAEFSNDEIPTLHRHIPTQPRARPLNYVIVLEESLGAEFVGGLGGLDLTPNLDALYEEGLAFDNLYATGTRSVRGIEALVSGYLPTPTRSVVKLPKTQRGCFTLAEALGRVGYESSFIYGGEGHFDNMARFFLGNGFDEVIDADDYDNPSFVGSWGVSDQDLFRRAHEHFESMGETPFFSLVFTSSNHSPWEFPLDGFELAEQPAATRNNAVKYADHALGEFFDQARRSTYWDDTLFLVVADHNSRTWGAELVPVNRFHIPAVFLGGSIQPDRVATLSSQVDLVPTALSLMGIELDVPALGRDMTRPDQRDRVGRAIMQFYQSNLFLEGDRAVVHRPHLPPTHLRWFEGTLTPSPTDVALEHLALCHALWPQLSYARGDFRLPMLSE